MKKFGLIGLLVMLATGIVLLVSACTGPAGPQGPTGPAGAPVDTGKEVVHASHGDLTLQQIAEIQFGLGSVMMEYRTRFDNIFYAAQANNWDMVTYQIDEMREIQEVAENTRPTRAANLKSFESGFLDPMYAAAKNKNSANFTAAYNSAINGCNACHAASSGKADDGTPIPSYKFVKITPPTKSEYDNVDWAGQ